MQSHEDIDHLRLLSIFHYIVGGITGLFSLLPLLHVAIGIAIVNGAFNFDNKSSGPPPFIGWIFIVLPAFMILCGLTVAICIAVAGRRLARQQNYVFCLVVAAIECTLIPFGTILGVFTIVVLMRPSVKQLFNVARSDLPWAS